MRCNDKSSNGEEFAHTKDIAVPIDEIEPMNLKFAPSYILDTIESISLKSMRKLVGYDTFESIRTFKRLAKKDTSDYYNITVNVMARRKSSDQCKNAEEAANKTASSVIASHALGGIIDKGFPYDDAQRDDVFTSPYNSFSALSGNHSLNATDDYAPTMFPGFYHSQLTMIGKQDIHLE
jgi:hypothetical protein